jgi:hypothetical protein
MKDQLQLRKSALVGFISTFSFMTIWAPKLAADTKKGAGFYAKLSSYINSYLVNKIDPFVLLLKYGNTTNTTEVLEIHHHQQF